MAKSSCNQKVALAMQERKREIVDIKYQRATANEINYDVLFIRQQLVAIRNGNTLFIQSACKINIPSIESFSAYLE